MKTIMKERITLKVGDKVYRFKGNSPTQQLYDHIYAEMTAQTPQPILLPIKRISIIDTIGEEACIASQGSNWSVSVSGSTMSISASCVWQSYENPAKIRVWGVDAQNNRYLYFETSIPGGVSAQNGLPVSITWHLTVGIENTGSTGYLSGASMNATPLANRIISILADVRGNSTLTPVKIQYSGRYGTQYGIDILVADLLRDQQNRRIYLPATQVQNQGEILNIFIRDSNNVTLIGLTPASPISVGSNDYIMFEMALTY